MKKPAATQPETTEPASALIDARIKELGDWRGVVLAHLRALILVALPDVVETWKWRATLVTWPQVVITTGETYKAVVKLTFPKGGALSDPAGLFNSSLDGNVRRAIDIAEGARIDGEALKALVREAAALNGVKKKKR